MQPLEKTLRNKLEKTIKDARDIAEDAARVALEQVGVGDPTAYPYLTEADRKLRRKLRAHGRQLGNGRDAKGRQELDRLIEEVAYEHWHRMLFARFLAENNLLMYPDPDDPVAVTLEECEDLAADEGAANGWELASRYAARMLPQIFRPDSPVFQLTLPPEHQQKLERLVADLSQEVFTASDSLGWVYQFWQAKKKDEINASEVKIGARELPAVTQLFTEPYMVSFLLDNSLGAWWAARRLSEADLKNASSEDELRRKAAIPGVPLQYLRFVRLPSPSGRGAGGEGKKAPVPADILEHARELRKNQTDAEQLLWSVLRNRRFAGKKFRRQHPAGRYILDFYCHEEKLAIELDGGQHNKEQSEHYDSQRTDYLNRQGIRVIRFWNNQVLLQTDAVLESLWQAVNSPSVSASPSPQTPLPGGEGLQDEELMWQPAAGTFDAWPECLSELKTLDPCCGSGHFLVAAFLMLVPMRMELESLTAREAVDRVLSENIHGLELDQRCVELAAFALAVDAWRYPGAGGYRPLPKLNLACTGLSVGGSRAEWERLTNGNSKLRVALFGLYEEFKNAPILGSLIDPTRGRVAKLIDWDDLAGALAKALGIERTDEQREAGVAAYGLAEAARLLAGKYHWVITNVPYLARGKQDDRLRDFCEKNYPAAKNDLATVFLDRCLELAVPPSPAGRGVGGEGISGGTVSVVLPQNWLFLTSYKKFREKLLKNDTWHLIARLGPGAFDTISGEVVKAILILISSEMPTSCQSGLFGTVFDKFINGIDVSNLRSAIQKSKRIVTTEIKSVEQSKQLSNPEARILMDSDLMSDSNTLSRYVTLHEGMSRGDTGRFDRNFWEQFPINSNFSLFLNSPATGGDFSGRELIIYWENGNGTLANSTGARLTGYKAWNHNGVFVARTGDLKATLSFGTMHAQNGAVLLPNKKEYLLPLWCYCSNSDFVDAVRAFDQKIIVASGAFLAIPFDLDYWAKIAAEKYPNGLLKPYSNDPIQWIFHGHPAQSNEPLQVAVARLLGYRWPTELDSNIEISDEARSWVKKSETLMEYADEDGIVCIPAVRGEMKAEDRLENLLAAAYSSEWSSNKKAELLAQVGHAGKSLETWLRDKFFTQHCKLFQHRPFIWHIWDGLRDGFAALVNYHKFDHKLLETLIYTYLGDWISRQKQDIGNGVDGSQEKLAAAESLKKKLELILEGEDPYDIFVRWKPIDKQPIGWDPDLNDGVRLNIRPFMTVLDVGKKGAGVLRDKPNIKWGKDRGKDVESAPWYSLFKGNRINGHHLTLDEKLDAQRENRK